MSDIVRTNVGQTSHKLFKIDLDILIGYFATSNNKNIPAVFRFESLLDEKDIYLYLLRGTFDRHMSDIYPSWVFTSDQTFI